MEEKRVFCDCTLLYMTGTCFDNKDYTDSMMLFTNDKGLETSCKVCEAYPWWFDSQEAEDQYMDDLCRSWEFEPRLSSFGKYSEGDLVKITESNLVVHGNTRYNGLQGVILQYDRDSLNPNSYKFKCASAINRYGVWCKIEDTEVAVA